MKNIIFTLCLTASTVVFAENIVITDDTKRITPVEQIHKFNTIDWEKAAARIDLGKSNIDSHIMICDDSYTTRVEIKFKGLVGKGIQVETDDCKLEGVEQSYDITWLQFNGPDDSCTIKVTQERKGNKPVVVEYDISANC